MPWELREGEPAITKELVRALLIDQHPDLAEQPLGDTVRGWDNTMVRLGESLALRLPRHAQAEDLLDREVRWLPVLARQVADAEINIPTAVRTGVPGHGYPFRWAIVSWIEGTPAVRLSRADRDDYAVELAVLLRTIHRAAPDAAPVSAFRGIAVADLADRYAARRDAVLGDLPPGRLARADRVWAQALKAAPNTGTPVWLHGDPHPGNTVLAGVGPGVLGGHPVLVDFGDLCAGDPASDLGAALLHFSPEGRRAFRRAYDAGRSPGDAPWARADGWAAYFTLVFAAQPADDPLHCLGPTGPTVDRPSR
jgi:aminoglycoside phosphotransferase (APT) family kinase protein